MCAVRITLDEVQTMNRDLLFMRFQLFFGLRYVFLIRSYRIGNSAALSVCSGRAQDLTFLCLGVLPTFLNWVKEEDMPRLPQRQGGVLRKDVVRGRCPQRGAKRLYGGSSLRRVSKLDVRDSACHLPQVPQKEELKSNHKSTKGKLQGHISLQRRR